MESCPNCENQIEQDQIICSVCGMLLKEIRMYPNFVRLFSYICLVMILITIIVNLVGHLYIFL